MVLVSHRDKVVTTGHARAPIYFCVFHLYKQQSSDNCAALEMEHVVTF
jgi:hypothetical protein